MTTADPGTAALIQEGDSLQTAGDLGPALAAYDRALERAPALAAGFAGRGAVLHKQGRRIDALASYTAALALRPEDASTWTNKALLLKELGRAEDALAATGEALAADPRFEMAHLVRAAVLQELGRHTEALSGLEAGAQACPASSRIHNRRGESLKALGRSDAALAAFEEAVRLDPRFVAALGNRGLVFLSTERNEEAVAAFDAVLAVAPRVAEAHANKGIVLRRLDRLDEALAAYEQAIALRPGFAAAHVNRGNILVALERFEEAIAAFDRAEAADPNLGDAKVFRGIVRLLQGDFERGLSDYEARPRTETDFDDSPWPLWRGEEPAGKTIIVLAEQGRGDTIQFVRYLDLLVDQGARVLFRVPGALHHILRKATGRVELREDILSTDQAHYCAHLMSLPWALGTRLDTIPWAGPYIDADPQTRDRWRPRIEGPGFKIGIAWQGNPDHAMDNERSVPLTAYKPLSEIEGVRLISLQKNFGAEQLDSLPEGMAVERLGPDFDAGPDAFRDTAAVMAGLDLVVTTDTAMAHLAGAMGVPVFVALRQVPDWRWLLKRADTPWYPSMRLFRQRVRGDWDGVVAAMAAAVRERVALKTSETADGPEPKA
ncbi:MAG: tetratricopeptide repeat protein [Alphaproteobacteria bacterium]